MRRETNILLSNPSNFFLTCCLDNIIFLSYTPFLASHYRIQTSPPVLVPTEPHHKSHCYCIEFHYGPNANTTLLLYKPNLILHKHPQPNPKLNDHPPNPPAKNPMRYKPQRCYLLLYDNILGCYQPTRFHLRRA